MQNIHLKFLELKDNLMCCNYLYKNNKKKYFILTLFIDNHKKALNPVGGFPICASDINGIKKCLRI